MTKALKRGAKVVWETSQGETRGKVVKKQAGRSGSRATRSPPSDKSGDKAAHKPDALRKF